MMSNMKPKFLLSEKLHPVDKDSNIELHRLYEKMIGQQSKTKVETSDLYEVMSYVFLLKGEYEKAKIYEDELKEKQKKSEEEYIDELKNIIQYEIGQIFFELNGDDFEFDYVEMWDDYSGNTLHRIDQYDLLHILLESPDASFNVRVDIFIDGVRHQTMFLLSFELIDDYWYMKCAVDEDIDYNLCYPDFEHKIDSL